MAPGGVRRSADGGEQAGGFPIGFRTAYMGLVERSGLRAGETLVVLGGAGSSGVAAIQLGKALGATVIAVAGSPEKVAFCQKIGADHAVSYRTADLAADLRAVTDGRGVDLIYDVVGGDTAAAAVGALARHGRIAIVGYASGAPITLDPVDMLLRNYSAVGVLSSGHTPEEDAAAWGHLAGLAEQGAISTPIGTVWSFDQVPEMIVRQTTPPPGKSVVRIS